MSCGTWLFLPCTRAVKARCRHWWCSPGFSNSRLLSRWRTVLSTCTGFGGTLCPSWNSLCGQRGHSNASMDPAQVRPLCDQIDGVVYCCLWFNGTIRRTLGQFVRHFKIGISDRLLIRCGWNFVCIHELGLRWHIQNFSKIGPTVFEIWLSHVFVQCPMDCSVDGMSASILTFSKVHFLFKGSKKELVQSDLLTKRFVIYDFFSRCSHLCSEYCRLWPKIASSSSYLTVTVTGMSRTYSRGSSKVTTKTCQQTQSCWLKTSRLKCRNHSILKFDAYVKNTYKFVISNFDNMVLILLILKWAKNALAFENWLKDD